MLKLHGATYERPCISCNKIIPRSYNDYFYTIRGTSPCSSPDDIVLCEKCSRDEELFRRYEILGQLGE